MPYIDATVWVGTDEFDDDDLINELKSRGFKVFEDQEYIGNMPPASIQDLYTAYTTMSPEFFQKELKKYFRENLNVNEY